MWLVIVGFSIAWCCFFWNTPYPHRTASQATISYWAKDSIPLRPRAVPPRMPGASAPMAHVARDDAVGQGQLHRRIERATHEDAGPQGRGALGGVARDRAGR